MSPMSPPGSVSVLVVEVHLRGSATNKATLFSIFEEQSCIVIARNFTITIFLYYTF